MAYADEVLADSPVVYLRFDDGSGTTAADSSGNGNNATTSATPTWQTDSPLAEGGTSVVLATPAIDGGTDYGVGRFTVGTAAWVPDNEATMECWFKFTDADFTAAVLSGHGSSIMLAGLGNSISPIVMWMQIRNPVRGIARDSGGSGLSIVPGSPSSYGDGAWHHMVFTVQKDSPSSMTGIIYMDGVQVVTGSYGSGVMNSASESLTVGGVSGTEEVTIGPLAEWAFYDYPLDATRVAAHYAAAAPLPTVSATLSTVAAYPTIVVNPASSTVTVTLLDTDSNPVSGKTVTLTALSGSSTITTISGTTDGSGEATFTVVDFVGESVTYEATDVSDSITISDTASVTFAAASTGPPIPGDSTGVSLRIDLAQGLCAIDETRALAFWGSTDTGLPVLLGDGVQDTSPTTGVAQVMKVNPETLAITLGSLAVVDPSIFTGASLEAAHTQGVGGDWSDNSLGVEMIAPNVAMAGYLYLELTPTIGSDYDGDGDLTGSDVFVEGHFEDNVDELTHYEYTKLCPIVIDGMSCIPGRAHRVTQRIPYRFLAGDFLACDQVLRLEDNKGAYLAACEDYQGHCVVFNVVNGELDQWQDNVFAPDAPSVNDLVYDADDFDNAYNGWLSGMATTVSSNLIVATGANGYFDVQPLTLLKVTGLNVSVVDRRPWSLFLFWPICVYVGATADRAFVYLGGGVAGPSRWAPPVDLDVIAHPDQSNSIQFGAVAEIDLAQDRIADVRFLGALSEGWLVDGDRSFVGGSYLNGRHFGLYDGERPTRAKGGEVFVANDESTYVIDPLCQTFPQTRFRLLFGTLYYEDIPTGVAQASVVNAGVRIVKLG